MRVLLLITDLDLGGTPIVVRELATRLRSEALHVEVACLKPAGVVGDQLRERGVAVTSFNARSVIDYARVKRELIALVRGREIDVLMSFLIHANFIAARAASALAPRTRLMQSIQTTQPRPRWHWWLQRRIARAASATVVPSRAIVRRTSRWPHEIRKRIVVIPNAVDVDEFCGTGNLTTLAADHGQGARATNFSVGFVGRLDPVKRVPDLLDAIALSPADVRLDIFGDGAERSRIEKRIAMSPSQKNRVTLHGMIADTRQAYAAIDVLVLPSDAEGFGLVLIEAMAAGVPVIGTNVDGIRDVIRDGETGLLVPPRDPAALARAIARLRDDPALRERLTQAASADVATRFAWPAVLDQYRALLRSD